MRGHPAGPGRCVRGGTDPGAPAAPHTGNIRCHEDDIDSELSPDKFDDDSFVSKDILNKDEGEQSNAVSGGWHGR